MNIDRFGRSSLGYCDVFAPDRSTGIGTAVLAKNWKSRYRVWPIPIPSRFGIGIGIIILKPILGRNPDTAQLY